MKKKRRGKIKKLLWLLLALLLLGGMVWGKKKPIGTKFNNFPLSDKGKKIFLLKQLLSEAGLSFTSNPHLGSDGESLEITIKNGVKVVFSLKKDLQKQIISLQLILREVRMKEKGEAKIIDLRGDKPYVVF